MMVSFKSKDKLKKEILKELQDEMKKEQDKEEKKSKQKVSSLPVNPPKKVNNSPEDLKEIQMKFLKLSVGLFLLILIFILLFIYSDYIFGGKSKNNKKSNNTEVVESSEKKENTNEEKLSDLKDGSIDISDTRLRELYYMFGNYTYDYFLMDTTFLYSKDKVLTSDLTHDQLLFLMSRTNEFQELIDAYGLKNEAELCYKDGTISLDKSKLDEVLLNKFNRKDISFKEFNSAYYINNQFVTYFKFKNNNGIYKSSCFNKAIVEPKVLTEVLAYGAEKKDDIIVIDLKVVFLNEEGIYKDYALKNKIRDLVENGDNTMDYVDSGTPYKATFKQNENKDYYFYGIEKVNE